MPPSFRSADAEALLSTLDQIHLVAIGPNERITGYDFGTDLNAALIWAERENAEANIYWTVNSTRPRLNGKPRKGDIRAARFVHVDIDPPKTGGAFDKGAIIAAMEDLRTPPSFVIDSGGGLQAFWRLDGPALNLASIETINLQVRDFFEADACQNIDRLMRVPGSVNWPDARKKARGRVPSLAKLAREDDGTVYSPEELAAAFPPPKERPAQFSAKGPVSLPPLVSYKTPDDLGLSALDPIRLAIEEPPGNDRSGDGLAVARLMANAGHDDATIMGVLLNPANRVSGHFLDQRDPKRAAARAIATVRADGPREGETLGPPPGHQYFQIEQLIANINRRNGTSVPQPAAEVISAPSRDPSWLHDLGGGLRMFVDYVTRTAPSPQPWLTLGAALAMYGAVAGRRYAGPTNLRTNVYSIGIADSGGGKDHPLRSTAKLMIAAGLAAHVGGSKIASGSGLISAVTAQPSILFPIDEIGFLISAAADRRRSPKHVTEILDNLTEFYSMADSTFLGTEYANKTEKPREVIEQPCLCLFGVTTPAAFWASLSSSNVMDGSLARMLIFRSDNDYPNPRHEIDSMDFPADLVAHVQAVSQGADGHIAFPLGEGAVQRPRPYQVPYRDQAAALRARAMREEQTAMLRKHQGTAITSIIARLAENASKVALIKAICDNPASPSISTDDLEWGYLVASKSVDTLMRAVREHVSDSDAEAKLKRLHRIIADAGSAGIEHELLCKQARFYGSRRQLQEGLDFLCEGGSIRVDTIKRSDITGGRAKRIYYDID
jgi:hypothetical protein